MAARNVDNAHKVLKNEFDDDIFPRQNVDIVKLDITDESSIQSAADYVKTTYSSHLDILVNNAGIAFRSNQFNDSVIDKTLATNYYGTVNVTKAMLPFVRERIFFVSSRAGALQQYSKQRQSQFLDENLTEDALHSMIEEFKRDSMGMNPSDFNDELAIEKKGWTLNAYNMSKACVSMYSRILARDLFFKEKRRVFVGAYCPGHCKTEMSNYQGDRSPVEGAFGITTMATMLLDHEEEEVKRKKLNLKEDDLVPFDTPHGSLWTAFFAKQGDLNSVELEAVDWVNPADTLSWQNILQNLVIRKGKGVLSIDEQSTTDFRDSP